MNDKISKWDFGFSPAGFGAYQVRYTSPTTNKSWMKRITDMEIIDKIIHEDDPKIKDLEQLKRMVKSNV